MKSLSGYKRSREYLYEIIVLKMTLESKLRGIWKPSEVVQDVLLRLLCNSIKGLVGEPIERTYLWG